MTAQNFMNVVRFKLKSDCIDQYFEVIDKTSFEGMTQRYIAKTGDYDYNFSIDFTKTGELKMNYIASGAKLESISYSNSIGSNRTISMDFSVRLDLDDDEKGFFVSGLITEIDDGDGDGTNFFPEY